MTEINRLIATLSQRALRLFAPDELDEGLLAKIRDHVSFSAHEAEMVQCVGMTQPIPLLDLYQPTRIKQGAKSVLDIRTTRENAVIYAGPGQGKTTLLKFMLLTVDESEPVATLFFSLRTEGHTELLNELINVLDRRRRLQYIPPECDPILLLVDGYDEIGDLQQKDVSQALNRFAQARVGSFVLTCRTGYTVYNISCSQHELAEFDTTDAVKYVDAFARTIHIELTLSGAALVKELEDRKLSYIASHPLMLTLACVVKSRTNPQLPHNSIDLLRQAMETLAFRWDEGRRIRERVAMSGLLSIHMMQCTMSIAYEMNGLRVARGQVLDIIARYIKLLRRRDLSPEPVLDDIRRFFGLIVTTPDGYCQFVHSTIHDYLAARYIVENGLFQAANITKWDLRAAYAASLQHDASFSLHNALIHSLSIEAVRECLINDARFDVDRVAHAVFLHFEGFHDYSETPISPAGRNVVLGCKADFFDVADRAFLDAIVLKAANYRRAKSTRVIIAFCMSEYRRRGLFVPEVSALFVVELFGSAESKLTVLRSGVLEEFSVSSVIGASRKISN